LIGSVTGMVVQLSWLAPASGSQPASYLILVGAASRQNLVSVPIDGSITSVTSPAPDGTYFVRIMAVNACGSSAESNEIAITVGDAPATPVPGAPMTLTAHVVGTQATLNWNAPVTGGAVARYIIEVTDLAGNAIVTVDTGNAATTLTQSGVPPGVYVVRVRAANAAGVGLPSASATLMIR
jgi:predicted phage tail protein